MNPAIWGLMTALSWGGADFIARFVGRALGHHVALFGMLSVGSVLLPLVLWQAGVSLVWEPRGWWLLLLTGVGVMVATLLLYWGLARGPVTIVAPIVGSYPALNVAFEVALGARPSALQWLAMAGVMAGVVVVARAAASFEDGAEYSRAALRRTVIIALGSSLAFSLAIGAAQHAAPIYGELQTVAIGRWISLLSIAAVLLLIRRPPIMPRRWWPWILLQGLLDGGAYLALLAAGSGEAAAIAVVVASGFGAVTVILARLILKEAMTLSQWAGIALIVAGVATLSAY